MLSGCATIFSAKTPFKAFAAGRDLGVAVFSPDGQTIALTLRSGSDSKLYEVNADGTGFKLLTLGVKYVFDPSISPDGTKILFCQATNGQGDICEAKIDGSGQVCFTTGPEHDYEPVYSPDGKKIYFLRARELTKYSPIALPAWHEIDVFSMNADGTDIRNITSDYYYRLHSLSVDPKGEHLMVSASGGRMHEDWNSMLLISISNPEKYRVIRPNLEKHREKTLFWKHDVDYTKIRNPRFSPVGNSMVFTWPLNNGLFIMDIESGAVNKIWEWESSDDQLSLMDPRFSRDGSKIIFNTKAVRQFRGPYEFKYESTLCIVNTDGSGLQSVSPQ